MCVTFGKRIWTCNLLIMLALQSANVTAAWKCDHGGVVEYTDQPCQDGDVVELEPAPPTKTRTPSRLVIEYQDVSQAKRGRSKQSEQAFRRLVRENAMLRKEISRLWEHKELELRNAAITDPNRMAAINLYWQSRIDALERQIDRNLSVMNAIR